MTLTSLLIVKYSTHTNARAATHSILFPAARGAAGLRRVTAMSAAQGGNKNRKKVAQIGGSHKGCLSP